MGEGKAEAEATWETVTDPGTKEWEWGLPWGRLRGSKVMGRSKSQLDLGTDRVDKVRETNKSEPLQDSAWGCVLG